MDHTILVVDDEPASLRALQRTLSPRYRVLAADSGEMGLEVLAREAVSLIVTDHRMPGLSGVEMLARARSSHPDAVRIVLTGYADVEALVEAINEGAVFYYLTKPWEPRDLLLAVRRGLEWVEAERLRQSLLLDLEEACGRAQREAEQKTRLLETAAHELGTPVHLVGNAVELLAPLADVRQSPWLGIANRGLAWLQRSLAQMRAGVRLRHGELRLKSERIDLVASLKSVLLEVSRAAAERQLEFRSHFAGDLEVHADRRWLDQVWVCLLSNAVRFTPDGGRIAVVAGAQDGGAVVQVGDNGIGMTPAQLDCAFEAFSTAAGDLLLHGSGRFEYGARGMGLGLSIAKSLVELHGGRIRLESEPGVGTTAEVWLPIFDRAAASVP